jgi:hypothetical protein
MYHRLMAYRYPGAYCCWRSLKSAMNYCPVLNIGFIANPDMMNIASDYSIKPNGTTVAQNNIPGKGCIGSKKTSFSPLG